MRHLSAKIWVVYLVVVSGSKLESSSSTLIQNFRTLEKTNRTLPLNLMLWRGTLPLASILEGRRTKRRCCGCGSDITCLQCLRIFEQTLNVAFGKMYILSVSSFCAVLFNTMFRIDPWCIDDFFFSQWLCFNKIDACSLQAKLQVHGIFLGMMVSV